jgi:acetylornithine deacetylase/succinyl-diaminopimelate desuccinylase-like protein
MTTGDMQSGEHSMTSRDLPSRVAELMPQLRADLARLVRLPSVAFEGYPEEPVRLAAAAVADLLRTAGMPHVDLLEIPGGPPVVYAARPAAPGAPTVLLYAHYDVQPADDASAWTSSPFEPTERAGRLYGRGAADDKSGIVMHTGALQALGADRRVGVKVLIEGQEEIGCGSLDDVVLRHPELVAADAVVIADSGNHSLGVPTLTTSLRGMVAVDVTVETLAGPVHSGSFGGAAPDALVALCRIIATLHDEAGDVAVEDLDRHAYAGAGYEESAYRTHAGVLPGVELIGGADIADRLFARPSINVIGIDAPAVDGALNALVPRVRARLSVRLAPGQDPAAALRLVEQHLRSLAPWGARVTVTPVNTGEGFLARTDGPAYAAAAGALRAAFGRDVVQYGQGGSIPLVAAFQRAAPGAEIILWGTLEPLCKMHAPDESVDLGELQRMVLAEALFLAALAG